MSENKPELYVPLSAMRSMMKADPYSAVARQTQDLSGLATVFGGPSAITSLGPGVPIGPAHPEELFPRWQDYTPGYNIGIRPRSYETFDYPTLYALANNWDVAGLCIEKRIDDFVKHPWIIQPRAVEGQSRKDTLARKVKYGDQIADATGFFMTPDQQNPWSSWISKWMDDLWKGDAATVFLHRNKGGGLYAAEIPDGQTIRPVIDLWGRRPQVPPDTEPHTHDWQGALSSGIFCSVCGCAPAYCQVIKGMNWTWYGSDEIIWQPRWLRGNGPYGHPPAEWIILSINRSLRRQSIDLSLFTEGTIPAAFVKFPESWTTQQGLDFLAATNQMFAGNDVARSRMMPIPGGPNSGVERINPEGTDVFEEFLLHIGCAAYGQSPIEMGFVRGPSGGLGGGKTAAGTQSVASQERDVSLANHLKWAVLDRILATYWDAELEFVFTDLKPAEDMAAQSEADKNYWSIGAMSTDWIAENRLDVDAPGLGPTIVTAQGNVMLVSDFLTAPPPPPPGTPPELPGLSPAPAGARPALGDGTGSPPPPPAPSAEPGVATADSPGAPHNLAKKADLSQDEFVAVVLADLSHQYPPKLTTWVPQLTWRYDDGVKVADMESEGGDGKSPQIVDAIELTMQADVPVDPLVLLEFPGDDSLHVANGNKRYEAAVAAGVKKLPAYIGAVAPADAYSVHAAIEAMQDPKYQPEEGSLEKTVPPGQWLARSGLGRLRDASYQTAPADAAIVDLAKWERKATKALKMGKNAAVPFESPYIPLPLKDRVTVALSAAQSVPDVRLAFADMVMAAAGDPMISRAMAPSHQTDQESRLQAGSLHRPPSVPAAHPSAYPQVTVTDDSVSLSKADPLGEPERPLAPVNRKPATSSPRSGPSGSVSRARPSPDPSRAWQERYP